MLSVGERCSEGVCVCSIKVLEALYCIASALDGYVMLSDRTPYTRMMTSQYMQQRLLQPTVYSSEEVLPPRPVCFRPVCLHTVCFHLSRIACGQSRPSADPHTTWLYLQMSQVRPDPWIYQCGRRCG